MKIGLLTHYLALGEEVDSGIGQHFRILADALAAQGHQVHVLLVTSRPDHARNELARLAPAWTNEVVPVAPSPLLQLVRKRSWPLHRLLENLRQARAASRAATAASRRLGLAVVETHSYGSPACFLLKRRDRPPVVTRVSTTARMADAIGPVHSRVLQWHSRLERYAMLRSDALVTHTRQHRDLVCTQEGIDPDRFALVPHGLPDPGPLPTATTGESVEFLYVGRFEPRKGIDVLLAAIPSVAAAHPHAVFTLAGSHEGSNYWQEFARSHPELAGTRVRVAGRVSPAELQALYRRCSALVAPSRYESFGLIYPEAMAHGKPVIGCAAGGIPEVVSDGVTGLLAQPGDPASLATCMARLADDAALRERLGRAGRTDFEARFSAATLARASVELYRRVIDAPLSA
jgi:glycosyltransferase involved in cell wall biosynthesis